MIRRFLSDGGRLRAIEGPPEPEEAAVWIDLLTPSPEEEDAVEALVGVNVPTREEMEEIEISSRLYNEDGAAFMTALLPALREDEDDPEMCPVTFVLAGRRLVTIRYHEPRAFNSFPARAAKTSAGLDDGEAVLIALLEAIVDRLADILERAGREVDGISRAVFRPKRGVTGADRDFQSLLEQIGRKGDLVSNIRDSLVTLERLAGFLAHGTLTRGGEEETRERVRTLARDVGSLAGHAGFLSQKVTFLLDATLGMINIEQNGAIKVLSVAAVAFLPPTLVASIYGMNFEHMPELGWALGYPFALGLMVVLAVLPLLYFKRRGWF
ncbi:magnesium transporter CorA family protein [Jannaschia formosa]|uniref:magnesium transporter CorA family protein n=1 Tax=Jannaschia formosa TaxID=2259592 RepID=UPI000E1BC683|nr:magnesium transporter CorA family protein [Jannaschia formosa]TFL16844.1 magnesium transporter [Jannaschia formosa]